MFDSVEDNNPVRGNRIAKKPGQWLKPRADSSRATSALGQKAGASMANTIVRSVPFSGLALAVTMDDITWKTNVERTQ